MTSKFTKIFQAIASVVQITNLVTAFIPAEYKPVLSGFLTILQGIQAIMAHYHNPDGTVVETEK